MVVLEKNVQVPGGDGKVPNLVQIHQNLGNDRKPSYLSPDFLNLDKIHQNCISIWTRSHTHPDLICTTPGITSGEQWRQVQIFA